MDVGETVVLVGDVDGMPAGKEGLLVRSETPEIDALTLVCLARGYIERGGGEQKPENRFVRAINTLKIAPRIPYHAIIGDRGLGDRVKSSDGIVAY
jgi:hypothetical protein